MTGDLRKYTPALLIAVIVAVAAVLMLSGPSEQPRHPTPQLPIPSAASSAAPATQYSSPPAMAIDREKQYTAIFETSRGKIVCDLFPKDAPITVNNFVFLAKEGFYNGTVFHRVIGNFMIQGGDPTASGAGGPGYRFADEVGPDKPQFQVGSLAMANAGPGTNGSQFFITHVATPHLQGKHTIFGQVKEGQDVVDAVRQGDKLLSVTIETK